MVRTWGNRNILVHAGENPLNTRSQTLLINGTSHYGIKTTPVTQLIRGEVHGRTQISLRCVEADVAHHSDNLSPRRSFGRSRTRFQLFAQDHLARKEFVSEGTVHNHDGFGIRFIVIGKIAAFEDGYLHRAKVPGRNRAEVSIGALSLGDRMLGILKGNRDTVIPHGKQYGSSGRLNSGQSADFFEVFTIELGAPVVVLSIRRFEEHRGEVIGIESVVGMEKIRKTRDEQSCTDSKD